ncbi:MAG: hypothetical protein R3A51_10615 [Nannocystaceae bacterium]|nr:hypothetical protein [Myxococcales bacterium]
MEPSPGDAAPRETRRVVLLARGLVLLVGLAWMIGSPLAKMVLDVDSKWLHGWHLYRGRGAGLCAVEYSELRADGSRAPLDRLQTLAAGERPANAQRNIRRKALAAAHAQLCRARPDAQLRVRARCQVAGRGWVTIDDDVDPCARGAGR